MTDTQTVDPALDGFQGLVNTLKVTARSAADLIDEARSQGAGDIASVLANLEASTAPLGRNPGTKLELLRQNLRDAVAAAQKLAEVVGVAKEGA